MVSQDPRDPADGARRGYLPSNEEIAANTRPLRAKRASSRGSDIPITDDAAWESWTQSQADSEPTSSRRTEKKIAPATTEPKPQAKTSELAASKPAGEKKAKRPLFRAAVLRTIGSSIIPGLGFLGTKAHRFGLILVSLWLIAGITLGITFWLNPSATTGSALQTKTMYTISVGFLVLALLWVTVILGTYLISKPRILPKSKKTLGALLVAALSMAISGPLGIASVYSYETARVTGNVFRSEQGTRSQTRPSISQPDKDPWAEIPRVNFLLLGGDSGEARDESLGVRTDTIMIASIETATGATSLIQLPRNLEHPIFPTDSDLYDYFPYGFDNGDTSLINAVWNDVPNMYPELFENTDYAGADALKYAIEGSTGLKMDYFVMVNMDGMKALIDAMGGVTVNVNFPIAKGGSTDGGDCGADGWIPEGPNQHLNGEDALWYGRSRCNDIRADYGRMRRQSCLVNAVIEQADATKMVTRYEQLAQAAGDMITTDIPQEHLGAVVELANRVQKADVINRLRFEHGVNGFFSDYPDFDLMKSQIQETTEEASRAAAAKAEQKDNTATDKPPASQDDPEPGAPAEPEVSADDPEAWQPETPIEDIADACAYRHEEPDPNIWVPDWVPVYVPEPSAEPTER